MVARGPGDVGCAHCTQIGATEVCQVCTHLVCPACAADWATCTEPSGRVIRLGLGGRLRDVDPRGHHAIVSYMHKGPRLLDLRQLRWAGALPLSLNAFNQMHGFPPRLLGNELVVHAEISFVSNAGDYVKGIRFRNARGGAPDMYFRADAPRSNTAVSSHGDLYSYVTDAQRVAVHELRAPDEPPPPTSLVSIQRLWKATGTAYRLAEHYYEPLPRQVLKATFVDGSRKLIAAASWRVLAIQRMLDHDRLEPLGHVDTGLDGNALWIAVAGPWIAYAFGSKDTIEVRELKADLSIGNVAHRYTGSFEAAALSTDGRHLALALGGVLIVHDLDRDTVQELREHTDGVNCIRFSADDHVLVTGDQDNRVILRPRTETGYARPLIERAIKDA